MSTNTSPFLIKYSSFNLPNVTNSIGSLSSAITPPATGGSPVLSGNTGATGASLTGPTVSSLTGPTGASVPDVSFAVEALNQTIPSGAPTNVNWSSDLPQMYDVSPAQFNPTGFFFHSTNRW